MTVFFTDRDLGKAFPNMLRVAGLQVELHADHFEPSCPDEEWLGVIGARGWVAVTHDKRIRRNRNELDSVARNNVALLVVVGHARTSDLARGFVASMDTILRFVERRKPPYIAKVYRPSPDDVARRTNAVGRIELWWEP